jgi:hypothetical protein
MTINDYCETCTNKGLKTEDGCLDCEEMANSNNVGFLVCCEYRDKYGDTYLYAMDENGCIFLVEESDDMFFPNSVLLGLEKRRIELEKKLRSEG